MGRGSCECDQIALGSQALVGIHEELAKTRTDKGGQAVRTRAARALAVCIPRRRKIISLAARDPESDEVCSDQSSVGRILARPRVPVFAAAPALSQAFLDMCARLPDGETTELLTIDESAEVSRHTKASSPGPDGLLYEVWAMCGPPGTRIN